MEFCTVGILQYWKDIRMLVGSRITMMTNQPVGGYSPLVEELSPEVLRNRPLLQTLQWRQSLWH
jgi:hypothetical protein